MVRSRLEREPQQWMAGYELAAWMRDLGWTKGTGVHTLREGVKRGLLTRTAYQEGPARYVYRCST